jgi:hypothetical protein
MTKAKAHKLIRKAHRYLGVVFGIQFLFWTVGGLYFSWTNIKKIRGEDIRKDESQFVCNKKMVAPDSIINLLQKQDTVLHIKSVQLINVLDSTYYQVSFNNGQRVKTRLANAATGNLRQSLTESEAIQVAKSRLKNPEEAISVKYLTAANGHHEYREKPLPAYAITFKGSINSTIYVSTEMGTVQSFRNNQWRLFDFLWMMHTMDYKERDNINNWVLRVFSILGLVTILSGFVLYIITFRLKLKKR